ncbi:DUF4359 domain-containing protein [Spirosoma agri]|uniref:DUF4359 domain-containing protein n=1 Tax=Spirosoma agri TaxID=1987381 RepID=A0A6M0ICM3_9BACT|nr:DUF4359 domain-containing protein [Spirosoma agri]NEU65505.1 DUF4359 domain-containing protein [Spirosoma agri]
MNKNTTRLILALFATLLLVFSNPSESDHKSAVKAKANSLMQNQVKKATGDQEGESAGLGGSLSKLIGGFFVDKLIDASVTRTNFLLFSLTDFSYEGKSNVIGFGVLGNVFITSKLDDQLVR